MQPNTSISNENFFLLLERPLVFFDIETTGLDLAKDRIVEIYAVKYAPNMPSEKIHYLVNPTIPISEEATEIHGITNEMVADKPTFESLSESLSDFFKDSDLGGFNVQKFDIPFLMQEFHRFKRYPILMNTVKVVDAFSIYLTKEKRDLASALKFYCGKEHINAHSAEADILATIEVLKHHF